MKESRGEQRNNAKGEVRERISELLLADRLGLGDEEWHDPDNHGGLPDSLPQCEGYKLSAASIRDLEGYLSSLVGHGCHPKVLYWCLLQLGPKADRRRLGEVTKTVLYEDESKNVELTSSPKLATREGMEKIRNQADALVQIIRRHRQELLLCAAALGDSYPLPRRVSYELPPLTPEVMLLPPEERPAAFDTMEVSFDEPLSGFEVIQDLLESLRWVKGVAASWQKPNVVSLVKSKGVLPLLVYAWMHSKTRAGGGKSASQSDRSRQIRHPRLARADAEVVTQIAHIYCGMNRTAEDLIDKLQDFQEKQPRLFREMVSLLESLDKSLQTVS